ncbi:MAG: metallophosphoesterase family protein [Bacteroidia bacterium]
MIKRKTNNISIALFTLLITTQLLSAQLVSPFNKLSVTDTSKSYSFIVSGHFHGGSTNISTFPASTILAGIDTLNALKPAFLISLGDLFLDVNDVYIEHYQKSFFSKLQMPLYNAVGNHDVGNGNMYEKIYGKTFFSFKIQSEFFIVLNTELNDGSIKDEQLAFFKNALNEAHAKEIKNIFILSHRPVWSENAPDYKNLFAGNTRTALGHNNYEEVIKPLIADFSKDKSVYWFSGSMAGGPSSFFYHKEANTGLTVIQTAIRDLPRDAVLQVNVADGKISFKGISLTGQNIEPIENYDIDYWKKTIAPEEKFNYRLLPLMTKQMLMHQYFWIGLVVGSLLFVTAFFIKRRWKRKK